MPSGKTIIGIDLGGTKMATAKVKSGKISRLNAISIPINVDKKQMLDLIRQEVSDLFDSQVKGIGVGVPSIVDVNKGIVYDVQNIPSWDKVPLKDILEKEFKVYVKIDNDANCFALGEMLYGQARSYKHVAGVTIGTGLGIGVINNGEIVHGANCGAGELGLIPYLDHTLEYYSSGQYFVNEFKMKGEEVYDLAKKNNHQALMFLKYFANHLGNALLSIIYAYDPEVIVIGGSVAKSKEFWRDDALSKIDSVPYQNTKSKVKIVFSELENAGILGAAGLI
ncbi:MAG: ROK family protein [Cyclobacteriaceae bacterium]